MQSFNGRSSKYAIEHNFKVSIAIVDETSSLLMMKRLDGASPLSSHLCLEKQNALQYQVDLQNFMKNFCKVDA